LAAPAAAPATAATNEKPSPADHFYEPLPQETGSAGLQLLLRRLHTTGRLMQVTAHPDDEDGGMLTLESRGHGVATLLMTLTRGEGGQNKLGSNLFDVLGVLRTLELLASDRYYGVEQRFSRVADFGYSKTPEETFQKWQGHEIALADLVRAIRTFRPDVLIARFSGTERDGHGHHQASAILTNEAFHAAADPARFPEQIKQGLLPWQPKKLYIGNVCGFGAATCDPANYTLRLNTGVVDPILGASYIQFAMQGLRHQQSQGAANWTVEPGDRYTFYKLVASVVDSPKDKDGHEQDFFDGIDTTLPGLAARLGGEENKVPGLRHTLSALQSKIDEAIADARRDPSSSRLPLEQAHEIATSAYRQIVSSDLSVPTKSDFQSCLVQRVASQIERALALAEGASLRVVVDAPIGETPQKAFMALPGTTFDVVATLSVGDSTASGPSGNATAVELQFPPRWQSKFLSRETKGLASVTRFQVSIPPDAKFTRPYWHRNDPETEALNLIDDPQFEGLPFPPPPLRAIARVGKTTVLSAACMVQYRDSTGAVALRPLAVAPAFSVLLDPGEQVISLEDRSQPTVKVDVSSNLGPSPGSPSKDQAALRIEAPATWRVEPEERILSFHDRGDMRSADFNVLPGHRTEGRKEIHASVSSGPFTYAEGYSVVTRDDLGTFYYYQPATQRVSVIDVTVPKDLKVGYVMGAGDDIPTVLRQIGMDVTLIPAEHLAAENLSLYQTIVLGIRAYDNQPAVIANNQRLLEFVHAGGRLVVLYNASTADFNSGKFTPYPATLSRARVSVEEAPVSILDPANPLFHFPNQITQKDFSGWVQERGLYFMSQWDSNFTPLLESHDPGEAEQKGGMLVAHYGKGTYIYTGYAFFRQLPAGVPGAVRLFVNLIAGP
jgi:LmbE family N-acetylglucosaminyl deacetylase